MTTKPANPAYWNDTTGYPYLNHLISAYFNQDFDMDGHTLAEIIAVSRVGLSTEERTETVDDIWRFLASCEKAGAPVAEEFRRTFRPEITVEGWEGLTTRDWLIRIAELLRSSE